MSLSPIITFKAGICDIDPSVTPSRIKARNTPGYLYLYEEDELVHFCWRPRSASMASPELELVMVPTDGQFSPYKDPEPTSSASIKSPTNGRIFVLKFQSSTQRHFFWLQSKSQHPQGDSAWFSPRDLKLGDIVDRLLQGDQVNASEEYASVQNEQGGGDTEGDAEMEDTAPEGPNNRGRDPVVGPSAGEGPQQGGEGTGGDTAPTDDAAEAVQNFLRSMQGNAALTKSDKAATSHRGQSYTTLPDLLPTSVTIPFIDSADSVRLDRLLRRLPPVLLLLSQEEIVEATSTEPTPTMIDAALAALSLNQKKDILRRVLRSPQFVQSLGSLTSAIQDGGLPSISDALKIPVKNRGLIGQGSVPLGGGDAMEAFINGIRTAVEKKKAGDPDSMDTE